MTTGNVLEQRLKSLIARYKTLEQTQVALQRKLAEEQNNNAQLAEKVSTLKTQIDALGKDRFALKQYREERKQIRKKLDVALARLTSLEQELES